LIGKQNIFLIGPMGSGKTAVGKCLARLLDYPFRDTDHEIERRTGADISLIFEREGEAGFRLREREVVAELSALESIVLATGGGAIVHPDTRRDLRARGWVVYLETAVRQQAQRAGRTRHRPMLYGADPEQRLGELLQVREPFYREIADFTISTNHERAQDVAKAIARGYRDAQRRASEAIGRPLPCKH
jgi:shikimate kinase